MTELDIVEVGGIRDRGTIVDLGAYWHDKRTEFIGGYLIYRGTHYNHDTATSNDEWEIWKYAYTDGYLVRIEGPLRGAWDLRSSLGWA
jgi:hypothetical protein